MLMQYFDTEEIELDINIDNKFTQKLHKSINFANVTAKFREINGRVKNAESVKELTKFHLGPKCPHAKTPGHPLKSWL